MRSYQVKLTSVEDVNQLVNTTSKFGYEVELQRGNYKVDAKSVMQVLNLGFNVPLILTADTDNAVLLKRELGTLLI